MIESSLTGEAWPADGSEEQRRQWFNRNRAAIGLKPIPSAQELEEREARHPTPHGTVKGYIQSYRGFRVGSSVQSKESPYIDGIGRRRGTVLKIYDEGPEGHVFLIVDMHDGMNTWASPENYEVSKAPKQWWWFRRRQRTDS